MKIVVIGGTGLIGAKLVELLTADGHEARAASPKTGVNTLTGEGLTEVLVGASVVVDVSNSPSFEAATALRFFETSTRNLLDAERAAGVGHHVALSVVGSERLTEIGYFPAKLAQEARIKASELPYSIVRATQFFEFVRSIAAAGSVADEVRLGPLLVQPMAADEVARALGEVAVGTPLMGTLEIAGPETFRLDAFVKQGLRAHKDQRAVIVDPKAGYYGAALSERALVAGSDARLGEIRFEDWLSKPENVE